MGATSRVMAEGAAATEVISGLVERVTFHTPETGFSVLRVRPGAIATLSRPSVTRR